MSGLLKCNPTFFLIFQIGFTQQFCFYRFDTFTADINSYDEEIFQHK
jgi:hypothetical protein